MKVLGTFLMSTLGKYLKIKKMKVLGTFPIGTLEKYLKMENKNFRYFSYKDVGKVPKNGK